MLTRRLGNWLGQWGFGLLAGALAATACGSKDDEPPPTGTGLDGSGARMNLAGRGGKGSGGGSGGGAGEGAGEGGMGDVSATGGTSASGGTGGTGGVNVTGAPVVHVTSPAAVTDPNDPNVIVADEIDVLCTATKSTDKGAKSVDQATVLLQLLDGDGLVVETHPGTPTDNEDEYTAHFITRKVSANGGMGVGCQASDTSSPAIMGTDRIDTFVDHGPSITPVDPPAGDADHPPFATAVGQPLHVAFKVAQAPVAKGDDGAAIGDVTLTVGGKPFDLTKSNGQYTATVDLDNSKIFMPTPDGDQKIVISAGNQRSPKPALAEVAYDFVVDGTGPDITILSPSSADIVSGSVQLIFKVTDSQSGVDESSITAVINTKPYAFNADDPSWSVDVASSTYTFSFDTTQIQKSVGQVTLKVKARDLVGIESDTEDVLPHLDNVPPFVDLDPPPVREAKDDGTCSLAFDPLGFAASDLDVVSEFVTFRGFVWDDTNHAIGDNHAPAATADLDSVVLFLQPNPEQGLLKDTTGDGVCDEIETRDSVSSEDLPAIKLAAVQTQGNSWFGSALDEQDSSLANAYPMPGICDYGNTAAPLFLCEAHASDLTRVVHWSIYPSVPVVFGVPQLQGVTCTGYGWEIKPFVSNGWICAALRAKDKAGNVGVSAPLRLCYNDGTGAAPDCEGSNRSEPPSCLVGGCRLPDRFQSQLLKP